MTLSTIFPSRFHDSSVEVKRAIDQKRFGRLTVGDAIVKWHRTQAYYDSGGGAAPGNSTAAAALMNQAIHSVDLLCWFMGQVVEVRGRTALLAHQRIAVEDVALATVEFANGAVGVIEASTAVYPGYLKRIEVHGTEGSAIMEEDDIIRWDFAKKTARDKAIHAKMAQRTSGGGGAADPAAIGHHGHTRQFRDVLQAIQKGVAPSVDGREGRRSIEVIWPFTRPPRPAVRSSCPWPAIRR